MRYFCKFSLVSLGIRPRSRRCAERTWKGEGRWSRPPKAALERSYIRPRIPVPQIAYFGRDKKKLLTKSLTPKKDFIYIYVHIISIVPEPIGFQTFRTCDNSPVPTSLTSFH